MTGCDLFIYFGGGGFLMNRVVRIATSDNPSTTEMFITFHTSCEFLRILKAETNKVESVLNDQ